MQAETASVGPVMPGAPFLGDTVLESKTPDLKQAKQFLDLLDSQDSFTFQTFDDSEQKRRNLAKILHGSLDQHAGELTRLNSQGAGVHVTINETDLQGRTKENIRRVRAVFVDLDGVPVEPVSQCSLPPHMIVETSLGRYHAYWKIKGLEPEDFPKVQTALAKKFSGDQAVKDVSRVMRLPGFYHCKASSFQSCILKANESPVYDCYNLITELGIDLESIQEVPQEATQATPKQIKAEIPKPGRNVDFASIGGSLRRMGMSGREIGDCLLIINQSRCVPSMDEKEVRGIAKSMERYPKGQLPILQDSFKPVVTSIAELMSMELPPIQWIVPGLLPEGLAILAGKPKIGKSWFAWDLTLAVSRGDKAFSQFPCNPSSAFFLALEDNPRRIQDRVTKILCGQPSPKNAYVGYSWPEFGQTKGNGLEALYEWIENHIDVKLIIVDTLAKVRDRKGGKENAYDRDYRDLEGLQRLAGQYGIAVLVLHHQRKLEADDIFDTISGSTGLTGCADTIMILQRKMRGQAEAVLHVTGRDIEEQTIAMTFDKETGRWEWLGDASQVMVSPERQAIRNLLMKNGPLNVKAIAEGVGNKQENVRQLLNKMKKAEEVILMDNNLWGLPEHDVDRLFQKAA